MSDDTRCSVDGCERADKLVRGWCPKHYARWKRHGDPNFTLTPQAVYGASLEDRFWCKVNAEGVCWEWTAYRDKKGYGKFQVGNKARGAHKVAWELLMGPVPHGLDLDHLCRNPPCVNPDHLEPVTRRENVLRGINAIPGKHHHMAQRTHCVNGHEYTEENSYHRVDRAGHKQCKTCHRERDRAWRQANREKHNARAREYHRRKAQERKEP